MNERLGVEIRPFAYCGVINPADMTLSPHDKPVIARDTRPIGMSGDPSIPSVITLATADHGTETPSIPTPPSNYGSAATNMYPGTPPTPNTLSPLSAISSWKP